MSQVCMIWTISRLLTQVNRDGQETLRVQKSRLSPACCLCFDELSISANAETELKPYKISKNIYGDYYKSGRASEKLTARLEIYKSQTRFWRWPLGTLQKWQSQFYVYHICTKNAKQLLKDSSSLSVSIHVFCVNLPDFTFSVDIILVNILGGTAAKPAGRAVLASTAAVHGAADDCFPFFFCRVFNQYGFHRCLLSYAAGRRLIFQYPIRR